MRSDLERHLLQVARCPTVGECLRAEPDSEHPCTRVVWFQGGDERDHQLPEPWSGDLACAPILFVGPNPSITSTTTYPRASWPDDEIVAYFHDRFRRWIHDGTRAVLPSGASKPSRFWARVKEDAELLLGRPPEPGVDYALTEVVRCKSKESVGVADAARWCAGAYLGTTLRHSGARVVVALGTVARAAMTNLYGLPDRQGLHAIRQIEGALRLCLAVPHPSYRGRDGRSPRLTSYVSNDDLAAVRAWLGGRPVDVKEPIAEPAPSATRPERARRAGEGSSLGRYAEKHVRARQAVGLDPRRASDLRGYPVGTRVRGCAGALVHRDGVVTRSGWHILPAGQMVVRFDDPVVDRYQLIAVLPDEVEPIR